MWGCAQKPDPPHALQAFVDAPAERVAQVVQTNLLGCLLCTRAAMRAMAAQPGGAHPPMARLPAWRPCCTPGRATRVRRTPTPHRAALPPDCPAGAAPGLCACPGEIAIVLSGGCAGGYSPGLCFPLNPYAQCLARCHAQAGTSSTWTARARMACPRRSTRPTGRLRPVRAPGAISVVVDCIEGDRGEGM